MSNTQLLQWLQSANGRIPSDAINQTAKSVWQTVSAPLKALFAIGEDPNSPPSAVFLADAFRPTADGASSTVALRRGLALRLDGSIGDAWDGDVKPMYADTDQVVAFSQNTDASGDDRIDLVVIRPDIEEEEPQTVHHKDTLEGPVYTKTVNTRRNLGFELDVVEGTPNAAPVAPSTPSGWVAICKVTRTNGQAAVLASEVEDVRQREFARFGALGVATTLLFGESGGGQARLQYDPAEGRLQLMNQSDVLLPLELLDVVQMREAWGKWTFTTSGDELTPAGDGPFGFEAGAINETATGEFTIEFDAATRFPSHDNCSVQATFYDSITGTHGFIVEAVVGNSGAAYGGGGGTVVFLRCYAEGGALASPPAGSSLSLYVRGRE